MIAEWFKVWGQTAWIQTPALTLTYPQKTIVRTKWINISKESEVAQLCPTLCNPLDCSLPGSSVHGILQARILEWVAISFSRGSSRPRDRTRVSHIVGRRFNLWATREETHLLLLYWLCQSLWLCGSQQTVENSSRDGNTRLLPEKSIKRSRSNS